MPERGAKRAFVAANMHLSNTELAKAAKAAGLAMSPQNVNSHKTVLRVRAAEAAGEATVKRKRGRPPTNGAAPAGGMSSKEAQLRKLVFELGFDVVQKVYEEFEAMHKSMRG